MKQHDFRPLALAVLLMTSFGGVVMHGALADDNPNAFNRLMKPASERNAPPESDGIHDPTADANRKSGNFRDRVRPFRGKYRCFSGSRLDRSGIRDGVCGRNSMSNGFERDILIDRKR